MGKKRGTDMKNESLLITARSVRAWSMLQIVMAAFFALNLAGCAYSIHQVYASDFSPYAPLSKGEIVTGKGEQFVILGFVNQTDYVEEARTDLMNHCQGGLLSGITTQISTDLGFFSWTNRALMQGLCIKTPAGKAT
jgi:hypothetical protein